MREPSFLFGQDVLTSDQFSRAQIEQIMSTAAYVKMLSERDGQLDLLQGKRLGVLFFEPSTRTATSFQASMAQMGGQVLKLDVLQSSTVKGETFEDTVRTVETYCDMLVIRHSEAGSVARAAKLASKPVLNAGDGPAEHPTQALLDAFTIMGEKGKLDGQTITFVGDMLYGRTVHSLSKILSHFDVKINYVSPRELRIPAKYRDAVKRVSEGRIEPVQTDRLEEVIADTDVLYVTRVQKERFANLDLYHKVAGQFIVTPETCSMMKNDAIILHPLPRVDEITTAVDADHRAKYFKQMEYGYYLRAALMCMVMGKL
jgi:aspartate carbamoyltransferase